MTPMVLFGLLGSIGSVPGVLLALAFSPGKGGRLSHLVAGVLINSGLLAGAATFLKLLGWIPLTRTSFLAGWGLCFAFSTLLLALRRRSARETLNHLWPTPSHGRVLLWVGGLALTVGLVAYPKLVIENFNGDGTEVFAPAESLRTHLLPYWDLEVGSRFGLPNVQPYWGYHFLMLPWLLLLGSAEAAVRLPLLGYLFLLFLAGAALLRRKDRDPFPGWLLAYWTACLLWTVTLLVNYGGHDPHVADVAHSATYLFLATGVVLQLYCLEHRLGGLFTALALLGILTKYWAGCLSFWLLAAAGWRSPADRGWFLRRMIGLATGVGAIALAAVAVAWKGGYLGIWMPEQARDLPHFLQSPWGIVRGLGGHLGQWVILGGILPFFSLLPLRSLPWAGQVLALTTVAYSGLLACVSPSQTFHAHVVLGLLTMLVGGYRIQQMGSVAKRVWQVLPTVVLVSLVLLALPRPLGISTANRELGAKTCMLFSRYEEAMAHARIADHLFEHGLMGGHIDYPAWVHYATVTRSPTRPFLYYLSDRPEPPVLGAVFVAKEEGSFFFAATPSAAQALRDWTPAPRPRLAGLRDLG